MKEDDKTEVDTSQLAAALVRNNVPENLHCGLLLWASHGKWPGSFLCAVLRNDLRGSFENADDSSTRNMLGIVSALYQDMPGRAWGSDEAMDDWTSHKGLSGLSG